MAVEMLSWPSLHERMCRTWGSNSGPFHAKRNRFRSSYRARFVSVNMKCYGTVNNSYWPPLRVNQYEVNTSWPPQQKSIVLQYWKPKINSFSYAEKKKIWHMCANFWINPHNGKLPSRLAPAQCQNSLAPQLLSNNCWSKAKTSISLKWVYVSYLFLFYLYNGNHSH